MGRTQEAGRESRSHLGPSRPHVALETQERAAREPGFAQRRPRCSLPSLGNASASQGTTLQRLVRGC